MKNSVVIKGNKYGIMVILDKDMPFDELKKDICEKFKQSSKFFGKTSMAVTFDGRELDMDEERQVLDIISENSDIDVICVIDNDKERENLYKKSIEERVSSSVSENNGQFYKGTLRSGQVLECDSSVVILGDVNPGAKIISTVNVIVLGSLKGIVYAGIAGDISSFVVALEMNPVQIRIGDIMARCADDAKRKRKKNKPETKIAFVEDDNIYIETLNKEVLNDLHF